MSIFKIVGYVALIFGCICTIGIDIMKDKADSKKSLQQQSQMTDLLNEVKDSKKLLEPFSDLATRLYPSLDQKDALDKLRERLDSMDKEIQAGKEKVTGLSSQLEIEKNTIKSFEAAVSIVFSGNWKNIPYPLWLQSPKPLAFLRWQDASGKLPDLEFCASKINYETINQTTGLFKNTLEILPGTNPLGELRTILNSYDHANFWFSLTMPENLISPVITINKVDIVFFINGTKMGEYHSSTPFSQDYSQALKQLIPGKVMYLNPTISITGKPVDVFKFSL